MAQPKLTITNQTSWTTPSLRKLIRATMNAVGVRHAKSIFIKPGSGVSVPSYGTRQREATTFDLKLREPDAPESVEDAEAMTTSTARLVMWALMVCRGVRTRDMTDEQRNCCQNVDHITKGRTLKPKPPKKTKPAPEPDPEPAPVPLPPPVETPAERGKRLQDARAAHAEAMLTHARKRVKKCEADLKRAQTVEARWLAKVRYYAKRGVQHMIDADSVEADLAALDEAFDNAVQER